MRHRTAAATPQASLVMWVSRDLEDRVRMLVIPRAEQIGLDVVDDPIRFVHRGLQRPRSWVRGWKLIDRTGVIAAWDG